LAEVYALMVYHREDEASEQDEAEEETPEAVRPRTTCRPGGKLKGRLV
jgi:hypothetical protein